MQILSCRIVGTQSFGR